MWQVLSNRRVWLAAAAAAALAAVALWPATVAVESEPVIRTPLLVTIDDEGVTRVRDVFVVSAPVAGRVQRIEVEPGDTVRAGQVLTFVRPELSPLLDAQTRADLSAAVIAARANVERARAQRQQAVDVLAHTRRERDRARDLLEGGLETRQHLDAREADVLAGAAAADAALHAVEAAEADVQRAAARLAPPRPQAAGRPVAVTAPVAGVVLRRLRESESVVPGGDPLLHLGDPSRLEIVVDLLSTEAVRVVA
ncbi:MAG: biotin/lipoyl-binding protein, partial [Acidobacteria bacterium]|nr:biotin/lipoyl-binding protein [Acidobacteriota bacterium]